MCRNTNTHEIEKDADEPSPEVTVEEAWCMAVQDTVDGHCDCIDKHDVISEHREESKFQEFPEHRDESKKRKVITNIETGQHSGKVITNIETGHNSRKVITNIETGQFSGKIITTIETGQNSEKIITNIETGQNLETWSRRSR